MKTVTNWIVILASIIGILIFVPVILQYYSEIEEKIRLNKGINSFYVLYNTVNKVCESLVGEKRVISLYYPKEIIYIYGQNNKLCYKTKKEEICEKVLCNINFFNISIYKSPYFEALENEATKFEIVIEKIEADLLDIKYSIKI